MRLFLAINLPLAERRAIAQATAPLRTAARDVTWVAESNLHLTMKFLGEQPEDVVARLRAALAPVARAAGAARLELRGFGAFPTRRAPRVIWLGVQPEAKLELLHHGVEEACARAGYEPEGRAFRPHVTLGRVRSTLAPPAARELADAVRGVRYAATVPVAAVDIMASQLTAAGPRYRVVESLPVGGRTE